MQQELELINRLVDRKKAYLQKVQNERMKQAIQAEINIIERFVGAINLFIEQSRQEAKEHTTHLEKRLVAMEKTKRCLELVCIMHGVIDYQLFVARGEKLLLNEIQFDMQENCRRVPTEIKEHL